MVIVGLGSHLQLEVILSQSVDLGAGVAESSQDGAEEFLMVQLCCGSFLAWEVWGEVILRPLIAECCGVRSFLRVQIVGGHGNVGLGSILFEVSDIDKVLVQLERLLLVIPGGLVGRSEFGRDGSGLVPVRWVTGRI